MTDLATRTVYLAASSNPFEKVVPDPSVFGVAFTTWWEKALGGVWALAIVYCAFKLITAAASAQSNKRTGYQAGVMESVAELKTWGIGTGAVLGAGVIMGALIALSG